MLFILLPLLLRLLNQQLLTLTYKRAKEEEEDDETRIRQNIDSRLAYYTL